MHPQNLLLEHVGAATPSVEAALAASPPRAWAAAPPRVGVAAPPRARRVGAVTPPRARRVGAAAPPPSPASLDGSLDAMRLLEEGEALGFTS
jgi:hypothetical protein